MPWVAFEPTITVFDREKIVHALDCAATVIGIQRCSKYFKKHCRDSFSFFRKASSCHGDECWQTRIAVGTSSTLPIAHSSTRRQGEGTHSVRLPRGGHNPSQFQCCRKHGASSDDSWMRWTIYRDKENGKYPILMAHVRWYRCWNLKKFLKFLIVPW
jgi:hypothetical protein